MPAFVIVENAATNQDAYAKEFVPVMQKAIRDYGGKPLAAGVRRCRFEGSLPSRS